MKTAPYGTWHSPISADLVSSAGVGIGSPLVDGNTLYWVESRPKEGGRMVVVTSNEDGIQVLTPDGFNVRTRVHEYGGGAYTVSRDVIYFSNFADQRLYEQPVGHAPKALTPAEDIRFADCDVDHGNKRLLCVREDHRRDGEAVNAIVAVSMDGNDEGAILVSGADFYAYPRLSADGKRLAWISWDHPNMPWDHVSLWIGDIDGDGTVGNAIRINEGIDESVLDLQWSDDGTLYFAADRTGWWNLHRYASDKVTAVLQMEAEFGGPLWNLGQRNYTLVNDKQAAVVYHTTTGAKLALLNLDDGSLTDLDARADYHQLTVMDGDVVAVRAPTNDTTALVKIPTSAGSFQLIRQPGRLPVDPRFLSQPRSIEFPTAQGKTARAYYYPPANADFAATTDELPPLLVKIHGGPTGYSSAALQLGIQFWTSRGFAVVDVNYGGSTGYGREYRNRLRGKWGIVDLEDTVNAVKYLVANKKADPDRIAIRGGSAGGYTTLAALAFSDVFSAGANYYGVSDLEALAKDTHKFESRYLDSLVGPYPADKHIYEERAPINHLDGFDTPLIVFQGTEDRVVPPNQSEMIVDALRAKKVPVAYLPFEGEQHGFRQAKNIIRSLEAELYFYGQVFGFTPADDIAPVDIENAGGLKAAD